MKYIYEVIEYMYYGDNSKLYESLDNARIDFQSRVDEFINKSKLVTDPDELKKQGINEAVIILDVDMNPTILRKAQIYFHRTIPEIESEPSRTEVDFFQINLTKRVLY